MADTSISEWEAGYTTTVIKFAIMTIVFIVLLVLMFSMGSLTEIAKNFPRYRCNPMIMPFASNFGYDTMENFNYCLNTIFQGKAAEIFGPIYNLLGGFTQVVVLITNVTLGIRKLFSNFLLGVNNFVRSVRDKIQAVLFSIRMSFAKLMNLMGRVYGTMFAVIFMGTSAMTAGFNIADNDLVKFLFEFCFDPDTIVILHDGSFKYMKELVIGDRLQDVDEKPVYVTSTFLFDGAKTPMVSLGDIIVSSEHFIENNGSMMTAETHPMSEWNASIPLLSCINVTGHKFKVGPYIFADYDEHDGGTTVRVVKEIAAKALNGGRRHKEHSDAYELGYNPNDYVLMEDGSKKMLKKVVIGDRLKNSGKVLGIVYEETESICSVESTYVTPATLLWSTKSNQWVRAECMYPTIRNKAVMINFITEGNSALEIFSKSVHIVGRDYREVPLPEMEDPYREALKK
jgi:hypothetical protein